MTKSKQKVYFLFVLVFPASCNVLQLLQNINFTKVKKIKN